MGRGKQFSNEDEELIKKAIMSYVENENARIVMSDIKKDVSNDEQEHYGTELFPRRKSKAQVLCYLLGAAATVAVIISVTAGIVISRNKNTHTAQENIRQELADGSGNGGIVPGENVILDTSIENQANEEQTNKEYKEELTEHFSQGSAPEKITENNAANNDETKATERIVIDCPEELAAKIITLKAKDVTPTGLTLVCSYNGPELYWSSVGEQYIIEQKVDGEWQEVKFANEPSWKEIMYMINPEGDTTWDADWSAELWESRKSELPSGSYRIGKKINVEFDSGNSGVYRVQRMYYAEFEIK